MNPIKTAIDAGTIPPRPSAYHPAIRQEIAEVMACELGVYLGKPAETLIDALESVYTPEADGYELGKALDEHHGWAMDTDLVNFLDGIGLVTSQILDAAHAAWVTTHGLTAPFPPGTKVTWMDYESARTGVVMDIQFSYHYPGRSAIKTDDTPTEEPHMELIGWERLNLLSEQTL